MSDTGLVKITEHSKVTVLECILQGTTDPTEIAETSGLEEYQVIQLLNDDSFYSQICTNTIGKLRLGYHTEGISILLRILRTGDNREKLAALDRLTKLIGVVKDIPNINVKFDLEDLLDNVAERKEKKVNTVGVEKLNGNIFEAVRQAKDNEFIQMDDLNFLEEL